MVIDGFAAKSFGIYLSIIYISDRNYLNLHISTHNSVFNNGTIHKV